MKISILRKDDGFWLSLDGDKKALINLGEHGKIVMQALEEAVISGAHNSLLSNVENQVLELKEKHRTTWRRKSQQTWVIGLLEEVVELFLSLAGLHKGPVEVELKEIAAICMNWLEMRSQNN